MTEIGVRVFAGHLFDRLDKRKLLLGFIARLCVGCAAMAHLSGPVPFYAMGLVPWLGWGVVMPMPSPLLFEVSEPRLGLLSTNLAIEMCQAGLALAPLLRVKREDEMTFGYNLNADDKATML